MSTIFTKIIRGDLPSYKIHENNYNVAFLDINPITRGHVLVVPKKEEDYIFSLEKESYVDLWSFTKDISIAMKKAIHCERIGVVVAGFDVPHAHIHLIPVNSISEINFESEKLVFTDNEFRETAKLIKSFI